MDDLTLLRDAHIVDPPDAELMLRERETLTKMIAHRQVSSPRPGTRRHRRSALRIAAATITIGTLAGVGAVAASSLLDDNTAELVSSAPCNITTDDAHLAVSATDTRGDTIELWTLDAAHGFGNLIVETQPDGTWLGASMGCDAQPRSAALAEGAPYAVAPNLTDQEATLIRLYGWVPAPATAARVTLTDGTVVTADATTDGYFLEPITLAPNAGIEVDRIEAVTADGTVVAQTLTPGP